MSIAERVVWERGETLGKSVGYQVYFCGIKKGINRAVVVVDHDLAFFPLLLIQHLVWFIDLTAIVNNVSHIQLSVTCRPTVGQQATGTLPTHHRQSADTVK